MSILITLPVFTSVLKYTFWVVTSILRYSVSCWIIILLFFELLHHYVTILWITALVKVKVKVTISRYRPRRALEVPGGWASRISRQSAHEGGKVVSPTHRLSLPQEGFLVLISVRGWVDSRATIRPEELSHRKIPVTPSEIEPATFRFVAQLLR
jgi:hypothetical protein